jgi:hypothetical protein
VGVMPVAEAVSFELLLEPDEELLDPQAAATIATAATTATTAVFARCIFFM